MSERRVAARGAEGSETARVTAAYPARARESNSESASERERKNESASKGE